MLREHALPKMKWGLIVSLGGVGLATGIAGFTFFGLDGIFRILSDAPVAAVAVVTSVMLALAGMSIGALIAVARERRRNRQASIALNNMTQGLSMFDGAARLVLCNVRYIEMSQLPPEDFREGTPLRDLLIHRAKAGTFSGDPDQYVTDCLQRAAAGRTDARTVELKDGRTITLIFCPLASGGWVSTHHDVTQQRMAEKERDSLRQREERRAASDAAIAAFRARVESMLLTVGQSAVAMKMAAQSLLTTSDHTLQRAEGAVLGSNEASANVETAAAAAEELSASIKEISRQLAQMNEVVQNAAAAATATNDDIAALARVAHRIGDCRQAHSGHCRADESSGAQCHDRGGARRRSRARLCSGGFGGEVASGANGKSDRRNHTGDFVGPGLNWRRRHGDPRDHAADAGDQRPHFESCLRHRAAGIGDGGDFPQRYRRRSRQQDRGRRAWRRRERRNTDAQLGGNSAGGI